MKKSLLPLLFACLSVFTMAERKVEWLPYGNMDTWTVRYIKESGLLGGQTKILYAIGPNDTIRGNAAYVPVKGNPWGQSNTYAKVVVETAAGGAVTPERRGKGYCCKLENKVNYIKVGNIYTIVTGSIFTGKTLEPVGLEGKTHPFSVIDRGVPFTQHPIALQLDYRALISPDSTITSTRKDKRETLAGHDCAEVVLILQHRWEDENGMIKARRVGTASERICQSIPEWVNGHQIPVRWGDITSQPGFEEYEALNRAEMCAVNSKGRNVKIEEVGYSLDRPTHMVLMISSSCAGAFQAHEGNILWVDNIGLVYEE